jgi:hypothetical protein
MKLLKSKIFTALLFLTSISGCSNLYVGNVKFSKQEVCSKEYASSISEWVPDFMEFSGVHSDCLPPTSVANAQRYYFCRFRLPVSSEELDAVDSATPTSPNLLKSVVGRTFIAGDVSTKHWAPPSTGNIFFIPSNSSSVAAMPTNRYVKSAISGIVERQTSINVGASAEGILTAALGPNAPALKKSKHCLHIAPFFLA